MLDNFKFFGKEWMKRMCNLEFFCQLVLILCSMHNLFLAVVAVGSVPRVTTKKSFSLPII